MRAVVLDEATMAVTTYADKVNLGSVARADARFLDPAEAVEAVWGLLRLAEDDEVNVAVSFAPSGSGVQQASVNEQSVVLAAVQTEVGLQLVASNETDSISYACLDHVVDTVEAFRSLGVSIDRLELSAHAIMRVLPTKFTGEFTFASGAGWKTDAVDGKVYETKMSPDVLSQRGIIVHEKGKKEKVLSTSERVTVSEEFLEKYQLNIDSIWIAAGAALGLVENASEGNLLTEEVQKRVTVVEEEPLEIASLAPVVEHEEKVSDPVGQLLESIEEEPSKGSMGIIFYALAIVCVAAVAVWVLFNVL